MKRLMEAGLEHILDASGPPSCCLSFCKAIEYAHRLLDTEHLVSQIREVFYLLGGKDRIPDRPGNCDLITSRFFVEIDEEQHFNRYRAITLDCALYANLPNFPLEQYRRFCSQNEKECIRKASNRGYWTNPSSERQFVASDLPAVFAKNGSARWKQRAFFDMLKDFVPLVGGPPVARISIWDQLEDFGTTVGHAIIHRSDETDATIRRLVICRSGADK